MNSPRNNAPHPDPEFLDRLAEFERRLDRLEETVLFQERTLTALHEVLHGQQRQLDSMDTDFQTARKLLLELREALQASSAQSEMPPHYQQLA